MYSGAMPVPVSFTEKANITSSVSRTVHRFRRHLDTQQDNAARFGEFNGVADQIGHNLLQAQGVTLEDPGRIRVNIHQQFDAFFAGLD